MDRYERLVTWANEQRAAAIAAGEYLWLGGKPCSWFDNATWACAHGHVSRRYLKSEERGALCLSCTQPVVLVPPGTTEAVLAAVLTS